MTQLCDSSIIISDKYLLENVHLVCEPLQLVPGEEAAEQLRGGEPAEAEGHQLPAHLAQPHVGQVQVPEPGPKVREYCY